MIYLDTSLLIAASNPSDVLYSRAQAWMAHLPGRFLTTDFVLCEFVDFHSKPMDRPIAEKTVRWLFDDPDIEIVEAARVWVNVGLELHVQRPDKAWSLTDCISFEVMRSTGITRALTYDHHFEQAGFEALLWRDPPG